MRTLGGGRGRLSQANIPPKTTTSAAAGTYVNSTGPINTGNAGIGAAASALLTVGADFGATIAMVVSWTLIGYGRAIAWELPIMGTDFTLWRIVISLPGSEAAVRLAMERLLLPELGSGSGWLLLNVRGAKDVIEGRARTLAVRGHVG